MNKLIALVVLMLTSNMAMAVDNNAAFFKALKSDTPNEIAYQLNVFECAFDTTELHKVAKEALGFRDLKLAKEPAGSNSKVFLDIKLVCFTTTEKNKPFLIQVRYGRNDPAPAIFLGKEWSHYGYGDMKYILGVSSGIFGDALVNYVEANSQ
jgi:hypothetical protein